MKIKDLIQIGAIIKHETEIDLIITVNDHELIAWGGNHTGEYVSHQRFCYDNLGESPLNGLIRIACQISDSIKTDFYEGVPRGKDVD